MSTNDSGKDNLQARELQTSTAQPPAKPGIVILFRSKLTDQAGDDYQAMDAELESLVRHNAGFIDAKSYTSADGERLTVVWWRDEQSLAEWRNLPRHREAQETGRRKWYERYSMEVAKIFRTSSFVRKQPTE